MNSSFILHQRVTLDNLRNANGGAQEDTSMTIDPKVTLSAVVDCLSKGSQTTFTNLPEAIAFGRQMAKAKATEGGYASVAEDNTQDRLTMFGEYRDDRGELLDLEPLVTVTPNWLDCWSSLVSVGVA